MTRSQEEHCESEEGEKNGFQDEELLRRADQHFGEDQLLAGVRLLRQVSDVSLLSEKQRSMLSKAAKFESSVLDLTSAPGPEWTLQGESKGRYPTMIYYKISPPVKLTARLETPIEPNLLVPLLAVFNESELYTSWLPSFQRPIKLGVQSTVKLRQGGRCQQLIMVTANLPWPMSNREVVIDAMGVDDIDANGAIIVKLETPQNDPDVPPPASYSTVRADFEGSILFQKCPPEHPALKNCTISSRDAILVCFSMHTDSKLSFVPKEVINFVTRTVLGRMWDQLLQVARDVKNGKRPAHAAAIAAKRETLYDWVDERIEIMLSSSSSLEGHCSAGQRNSIASCGNGQTQEKIEKETAESSHWSQEDLEILKFISF